MTSWKEERDRLVAQTLAFVQQVAAAHPAAANKLGLASDKVSAGADAVFMSAVPRGIALPETITGPAEDAPPIGIDHGSAPNNIVADLPKRPAQYAGQSERSDIVQRVAAFKARQVTLNHEREAYYESVQARIRSSLER